MTSEFLHPSLDRLNVCLSVDDQNTKMDDEGQTPGKFND